MARKCEVFFAKIFLLSFESVLACFGEEVDEVGLGIIVVGHNGGEGEEEKGDGDDNAAPAVMEQGR